MQFGLGDAVDHAATDSHSLSGDSNTCRRIGLEILQPVGGGILGDEIEMSTPLLEPDLDFARQTTLTASSGEIKLLLAVEITVL
jgi:hypothetical protein